ncbi:hypothetical protein Bbelb_276470 [Branchiostoma belcheri]|nr:hypothetical protein Bbelb_276470 [Branchiostoma belcheri]
MAADTYTLDVAVDGLSTELSTLRDRASTLESAAEYKDNEIEQLRKELQDERPERDENCEVLLDDFLVGELGFEKSTPLVAVHRLPRPTKTRPIHSLLSRLVNFHDRDRILKEGRKLGRTGFAVYEHLPPPLQAARAQLIPKRDAEIAKVKDTNTDCFGAHDVIALLINYANVMIRPKTPRKGESNVDINRGLRGPEDKGTQRDSARRNNGHLRPTRGVKKGCPGMPWDGGPTSVETSLKLAVLSWKVYSVGWAYSAGPICINGWRSPFHDSYRER